MSRVARGISGVVCAYALFALAGCSGAAEHGGTTQSGSTAGRRTNDSVALKTKYDNPEVAACMQRNGVTVLSNGELRVSNAVTGTRRKAIEHRCGFGVIKTARPSSKVTRHPSDMAKKSTAKKHQSFHSLLVAKIVTCLHNAGVVIPPSDSALLSSTSGIKTRSPQVKAVIGRCRSEPLTTSSR